MNRYFGRIVTRSESHSRQANSSTLFAVVSPGGGRSDVFDMEVFLASRRLSARSARHRCWSALERFDLRAFASVPAMPSKKNGISPEIGDQENRATIVAAPPNLSLAAFNDDVDHAPCDRHRSELRHDPARMVMVPSWVPQKKNKRGRCPPRGNWLPRPETRHRRSGLNQIKAERGFSRVPRLRPKNSAPATGPQPNQS